MNKFKMIGYPKLVLLAFLPLLLSCDGERKKETKITDSEIFIKKGIWRATLNIQDQVLPFLMEVSDSNRIAIMNGEERIAVTASLEGDSVTIPMHIFDTEIRAKLKGETIDGVWQKNYVEDYLIPFQAKYGEESRFLEEGAGPTVDISGKWSVVFTESSGKSYDAVGVFEQKGTKLSGTFLTTTGDYRFLEGVARGNNLLLSAFDGEHAYLFSGEVEGDSITKGDFWSGKFSHETWKGVRNEKASLPDADSLTFLKNGYSKIDFSFPDLDGDTVSLSDEKYQNKIVILQLFGTWCPNCLDETLFLSDWYKKQRKEDVSIIGLAYERKPDFNYAQKRVQKMVDRLDVPYDFLIAGTSDKAEAAKTLPMLNTVMSFPTTIFIDKEGKVRKIHTGFSGPWYGKIL